MKFNLATIFTIIFGLIAVVELTKALTQAEAEAMDKKATEACIKESTALTPDEIKRINEDKIFAKDQSNASNNLQCYLLCYYKIIGVIDGDGKLKPEALMQYMGHIVKDKSKIPETMQKCASTKSSSPCESVYNFEKCVFDLVN